MKAAAFLAFILTALTAAAAERIVSAGGGVTEIVYALGCGDSVVGVDTSSVYPVQATALPQVGYARALSAEGILSLQPDLFLSYEDAGPPAVLQQLRDAGVEVKLLPSASTVDDLEHRIRTVARLLGVESNGEELIATIRSDLAHAEAAVSDNRPRVLFIYARAGGILNVSGTGTTADAMIRLAGGVNAIEQFEGYKPLTAEAGLIARPDVILVTTRGVADIGGVNQLLQHPGLSHTPAGKSGRVVAMDDVLLLGFGPRLGIAVEELARNLHQQAATVDHANK